MGKNHLAFTFSLFMLLASACTHNKLKELVVYKTTYTYSDSKCDSVVSVSEHYYFNKDSAVIKYINQENGYFYLAEHDKKNHILTRKFFTTDSSFLYSSISQLNDDGLETKTEFYDTSDNITYSIIRNCKKNSKLIQKEQRVFSNGSVRELIYEYDENDNLLKQCKVNNMDSVVTEYHQITYDASDRIIHDTIYYPETRKIVENKYLKDKLFYKIEKFEKKSDTAFYYVPISTAYWKKYYLYNNEGNVAEIRNIKMFLNSKSFSLDSKMEIKYLKNDLITQKTLYNLKNQRVYSINMEYKF